MSGRVKSEILTLLHAVQFLTRLPVTLKDGYSPQRLTASTRYYPLVGVFIGAVAAAAFAAALTVFPLIVAVILSTALGLLLTGAFHEDGLADTFDGIGGGHSAERSLAIMKDSRIGVYGGLALLMALTIKIASLASLVPAAIMLSLVAGHALSRWSSVIVIATSTYVRDAGTAKPTAEGIGFGSLIFASLTGLSCIALVWWLMGPTTVIGATTGLVAGHVGMRLFFERKIGGYTGDCLGATQQASEIGVYLGILACQSF